MSTGKELSKVAEAAILMDGLRTIAEAAVFTRLSRASIYNLMERGELTYTKIGRRRLIPAQALVELATKGLVQRRAD